MATHQTSSLLSLLADLCCVPADSVGCNGVYPRASGILRSSLSRANFFFICCQDLNSINSVRLRQYFWSFNKTMKEGRDEVKARGKDAARKQIPRKGK
jgi:hypothetical protein